MVFGSTLWVDVELMHKPPPPSPNQHPRAAKAIVDATHRAVELAHTLQHWLAEVDIYHISAKRGAQSRPCWLRRIKVRDDD